MNAATARKLAGAACLLLVLGGLQACGQTGPLQLPDASEPVTATGSQDEDREDDER